MKKYVVKLLFPDDSAYAIFEDNTLNTTRSCLKNEKPCTILTKS